MNKDWPTLTEAFIRTGFFGTPIMYRDDEQTPWREGDREQLTRELQGWSLPICPASFCVGGSCSDAHDAKAK